MDNAESAVTYPFVPMLLGETVAPFDDDSFSFEIKFDGVRMTARIDGAGARLFNRRLNARTERYPEIARQAAALCGGKNGATLLDGEIIALDKDGRPDFYRVMRRDRCEKPDTKIIASVAAHYMVFDVMEYDGCPLYDTEYVSRRAVLEKIFGDAGAAGTAHPNVILVDSVRGSGHALFSAARAEGLEGIVAKRNDSPYSVNARSGSWLKIKVKDYARPKSGDKAFLPGVKSEAADKIF